MKTQFLNFSSTYLHGKLKTEHSRVFKLLFQNFRYFGKGWAKVFWLIEDPTQAWAPPRGGLWGYKPTRAVFKTICYLTNCPRCTKATDLLVKINIKMKKGNIVKSNANFSDIFWEYVSREVNALLWALCVIRLLHRCYIPTLHKRWQLKHI